MVSSSIKSKGNDPIRIVKEIMSKEYINMHGPEHNFLDGGSFMAALYNAGLAFNLKENLEKLADRTIKMPGAMCGNWGVCGSVSSLGAVFSILHDVGPLSGNKFYADDLEFTSLVLNKMSKIGGPRCCKRNAYLSISTAVIFAKEKYNIDLDTEDVNCEFSKFNNQCLKNKCPYFHN